VLTAVNNAVVWEGHNGYSPNSHGVSIEFAPSNVFNLYRLDYLLMKMAQDTNWDEWEQVAP
jgi:hypothetical protein